MAKLSPKVVGGKWTVDLRAWGFGRDMRLHGVSPTADPVDVVHAAYALLEKLRRGATAQNLQPSLPGTAAGGGLDGQALFTHACADWAESRQYKTEGGKRWGQTYLAAVRRELGAFKICEFEGSDGDDLLVRYVRSLRDEGLSVKTRRNRLSIAGQVLARCKRRGSLRALPNMPLARESGESAPLHVLSWYTEADFRKLRAEVLVGVSASHLRSFGRLKFTDEERAAYAAKRRLYMSVGFYTGMHTADLDGIRGEQLVSDIGQYRRINTKSSRFIKPEWFTMPEQLQLDAQAEITRLGRPFYPDELVCGGRWASGPVVMQTAAKHLGLPPINFRIFRCSTARELALRGWNQRDISEVLGHVDQRMIQEVYLRVPEDIRSPVKCDWTVESSTSPWLAMRRPKGKVLRTEFSDALRTAMNRHKGEGE